MNKVFTSNANNVAFSSYYGKKTKTMLEKRKIEQVTGGDQKLMDSLKWAGLIAAGALVATCTIKAIKKGNIPKIETIKDEAGNVVHKIGEKTLTFEKGVAMLDGKKARGILNIANDKGAILTFKNGLFSSAKIRK